MVLSVSLPPFEDWGHLFISSQGRFLAGLSRPGMISPRAVSSLACHVFVLPVPAPNRHLGIFPGAPAPYHSRPFLTRCQLLKHLLRIRRPHATIQRWSPITFPQSHLSFASMSTVAVSTFCLSCSGKLAIVFFFLIIVNLQYCVNFCCIAVSQLYIALYFTVFH